MRLFTLTVTPMSARIFHHSIHTPLTCGWTLLGLSSVCDLMPWPASTHNPGQDGDTIAGFHSYASHEDHGSKRRVLCIYTQVGCTCACQIQPNSQAAMQVAMIVTCILQRLLLLHDMPFLHNTLQLHAAHIRHCKQ